MITFTINLHIFVLIFPKKYLHSLLVLIARLSYLHLYSWPSIQTHTYGKITFM